MLTIWTDGLDVTKTVVTTVVVETSSITVETVEMAVVVTETKSVTVLAPARLTREVTADDVIAALVELVFFLQKEALEVALV